MSRVGWARGAPTPSAVGGPPKFIKSVSFPSALRVTRFRLPVSGPLKEATKQYTKLK